MMRTPTTVTMGHAFGVERRASAKHSPSLRRNVAYLSCRGVAEILTLMVVLLFKTAFRIADRTEI
jgi:hypothetical protein